VYDFLDVVTPVSAYFTEYWLFTCNNKKNTGAALPSVRDIAKEWRDHMRAQRVNARGNAFDASLLGQSPDGSPGAPDGRPPPSPCVCGKKHQYSDCYYLFPNRRHKGWKPNADVKRRVKRALEEDEKVRHTIERIKRRREASPASPPAASPAALSDPPAPPPADPKAPKGLLGAITKEPGPACFNTSIYPLHDSFILDTGADTHVCNNRGRFETLRPLNAPEYLHASDSIVAIEGYGTVTVYAYT